MWEGGTAWKGIKGRKKLDSLINKIYLKTNQKYSSVFKRNIYKNTYNTRMKKNNTKLIRAKREKQVRLRHKNPYHMAQRGRKWAVHFALHLLAAKSKVNT